MLDVVKKVLIWAGILLVPIAALGVLFQSKELYIGVTLGGAMSMLNFYMLANDTEIVIKSGGNAKKATVIKYLLRYFWMFAIVTIAVKIFKFNNFLGMIAGLFLVQFVIFLQKVIFRK